MTYMLMQYNHTTPILKVIRRKPDKTSNCTRLPVTDAHSIWQAVACNHLNPIDMPFWPAPQHHNGKQEMLPIIMMGTRNGTPRPPKSSFLSLSMHAHPTLLSQRMTQDPCREAAIVLASLFVFALSCLVCFACGKWYYQAQDLLTPVVRASVQANVQPTVLPAGIRTFSTSAKDQCI